MQIQTNSEGFENFWEVRVIFKESGEHEKQKHLVLTRNIGAQNSKLATIAIQAPDHDC